VFRDLLDRTTTAKMAVGYRQKSVKFMPTPKWRTFVCHIVNEVEVMTAKRCEVRDILRASSGSVSADLEKEAYWPGNRVERFCSESFSTGLMPGVIGVIGVESIGGSWSSSFALSSDAALGASTNDPLPSVVSRDSASSSNSKTRSLAALLLLVAYIRGAPVGQYIAARCRIPHS
jgi:hypothetical protein